MSLCVFMQQYGQMMIGADTAVTRVSSNGQKYRDTTGVEKLTNIGKYLIFACGDVTIVRDVLTRFSAERIPSVSSLQRVIKKQFRQAVAENPNKLAESTARGESLLGVICFEMDGNGRSISYRFNQIDGFKLEKTVGVTNHTHLNTGGFAADKALELAVAENSKGVKNPNFLIKKVFEGVAGTDVGGELTLYVMDMHGIELISKEKIQETLKYPLTKLNKQTGEYTALTGGFIRTAVGGARVELDVAGWRTYDANGRTRIAINANDTYGTSAIQFNKTTGSLSGYLNGSDSLFQILSQGNMQIVANGGSVFFQGGVDFTNATASGIKINAITGLQGRLNDIDSAIYAKPSASQTATNMQFDKNTRNLKLFSVNGDTLAMVNIP